MNKFIFILVLGFLLINQASFAQNGKILEKKEFQAPGSLIRELNEEQPGANFKDSFALTTMERVVYQSNKLRVVAYVIRPVQAGKYPVLIYNRDGYQEKGLLNELFCAKELNSMARWGYVVVASQYRGYEGEDGRDEFGGEDVNDVLNLIPMAAGLPYADTSRVGMYGFNRGGMMTYLAMTRSKQIDAAISESGISNLYLYAAIHTEDGFYESMEKMMPDYYSDKSGSMKKRSMAYWADNLLSDIPLLILHGSSDWDVHPSESQSASESLFKIRYPHRSILYEGGTNGLPEFKEEKNLEIHKWLDRYVRDQKKFPSIRNLERR